MRALRFFAAALLGAGLLLGVAEAQDSTPAKQDRIERIRKLPPEEKKRLKEALERFASLPIAEREALRKKAHEVGAERLSELAGRDFSSLKARHSRLETEVDEVMNLASAPSRFADLSPEEREFLRNEVKRRFQEHVRLTALSQAQISPDFTNVPLAERRERWKKAVDAVVDRAIAEKTPAEQNRIRGLAPAEQRRERARLFAEWRMGQTLPFEKKFENGALRVFLEKPPEARREYVRRTVRWYQLAEHLHADGVSSDSMTALRRLRADEQGLVALTYAENRALDPAERRARVEEKIRELAGAASLDTERMRRFPRLRELFQRERDRRGAETPPAPAASPATTPDAK